MNVDLRGSQADAGRFVHGFKHVVDQLANAVVYHRYRLGEGAQARIGKFEDV
ncbi:hypothetical protein ALP29_200673 [Pseudomonas syringae pv. avii]|uniref:Uncharacterized protein n=1 Tax=Pseudomonas syringae pv. avii TaxID=663959 RepID=A0A3M5TZI4_PSESX|nr:hypothetical protein ALP29_200673 [Pseudomonas syringae pv. avii]